MINKGRHSIEKSPQPASGGPASGSRGPGRDGPFRRGGASVPPGFYEAAEAFRRGLRAPKEAPGPAGRRPDSAGQPILSKPTLIISLGLHLALICFLAFGLPSCQDKAGFSPEQVITVQLMEEPSPPPPPPAAPAPEQRPAPEQQPAPEKQPPAFELPLGDSSRNLQRSGQAEAEAVEDLAPPPPPEDQIALGPKAKAPPPELEKRRDRKPEVKPPEVKRRAEAQKEPDYSKVPQALYRTLGRDAGASHFGSRQGRRVDPVVSRYFELALMKFNENWSPPQGLSPTLVVGFALTIEPNGRISSIRLTKSSGSAAYDRSVERAIKMASPLAPLPPVFGGQRVSQSFGFTPEGMGRRRQ